MIGEELLAALDESLDALRAARARLAFTAENFDESLVVREHGKFATKGEPTDVAARQDWMDPTAQVNAAVERIRTVMPDAVVRVHPEITDAAGKADFGSDMYVKAQDYADAVTGTVSGFERMAAEYPEIASRIGTIELGPTDAGERGLGQYKNEGSGQKYEGIAPPGAYAGQPRPLIQIDIDGIVRAHATAYRTPGVTIETHTVPSERADLSMERLTEGVATHEFGHAVMYASAPSPVQQQALVTGPFSLGQYDAHISDYAGQNEHEYFAEAFTANELGMGDRLNGSDREMLRAAGVTIAPRAAATESVAGDPPPDSFEGSIIWEYAQQDPRTAAVDEDEPTDDEVRDAYYRDYAEDELVRDAYEMRGAAIGGPPEILREIPDKFAHDEPAGWTDTDDGDGRGTVEPRPSPSSRRGYTAENFDESKVRRERGRFTFNEAPAEQQPVDALPGPHPRDAPGDKEFWQNIVKMQEEGGHDDEVSALMADRRAIEKAWESSVKDAIATGAISPDDARARWGDRIDWIGQHMGGNADKPWADLPSELWHVTTNAPAVEATGRLMTRDELDMASGTGLGGGASDTISLTDSGDTATQIRSAMLEARDVAAGEINVRDMIDQAETGQGATEPYVQNLMQYWDSNWKTGDPYPPSVQRLLDDPTHDTPADRLDFYKNFSTWREFHGGAMNPLFFLTDADALAKKDPSDIAIVKAIPVPNAQGVKVSALGEWRVPTGRALTITGIGQTAALAAIPRTWPTRQAYTKENFDESFVVRERGRFAEQHGGGDAADTKDAHASDYGLNYQAAYVNDPDLLAARKWNGWDAVPVTEVDPKSLVAVEHVLSSRSIDRAVSGEVPLREGYVARVVRKNDGTEIIVDGHHRAAMASAMDRPLQAQVVDASTIRADFTRRSSMSRFARRAYFDETKHPREHGRFTFKDTEAEPTHPDPGTSAAWDRLPPDQQQAVLDQAAKHRLDYDEMHDRAIALLDYAQNGGVEQMDKGTGWYSRMRDLADERAAASGLSREEYIGLVAATSPRMQWDWENYPEGDPRKYPNLNAADLMADLWNRNPDLTVAGYVVDQAMVNPVTGKAAYAPRDLSEFLGETRPLSEWDPDIAARILAANHMLGDSETAAHVMWPRAADALDVLQASKAGMDPAETLGGPKTFAFDHTLLDPNYPGAVIDAWMIQGLSGRTAADKGGANVAPGAIDVHVLDQPNTTPGPKTLYKEAWEPRGTVYTLMSAAVEEAAAERGMSPSDAQAVMWYVLRDTGFKNMPPELMESPTAPVDRSEGM